MILACDIGTTTVKAGIIDVRGRLVSLARRRIPAGGTGAFTARNWVHALKKALGGLNLPDPRALRAVAVSGNGPSLVLLDRNGKPLAPVLLWHEADGARAAGGRGPREEDPAALRSYFLPYVIRLARTGPRLYEKTRLFVPCPEFICYLLTGRTATTLPHTAYGEYFWSEKEIGRCGLDPDKFPPFIPFTTAVGAVTAAGAREFGLPQGVPVFSGGPDFLMALLGTGVTAPGRTQDRAGSSEGINHCVKRRVDHPALRTLPGLLPHTFNISGVVPRSGSLLEQAVKTLFPRGVSIAGALEPALRERPGADGLFFIPGSDPGGEKETGSRLKNGGRLYGIFINARREHTPRARLRAVLEGIGFRLRSIIETMEGCGLSISGLYASGGQALEPGLNQLKADILGVQITVPEVTDAELMGNACVAFAALGEYGAPDQAAQGMVRFSKEFVPRVETRGLYDDLYARFAGLISKPLV
jgi:xylulokinase